jgi:glycosyltransferase involved in cell wall biosynthesis
MDNPLLSVAVITYNQDRYIVQTLDSIINQEHSYPYEIIIGDDFSTDNTRQILTEYKQKYPNTIKLILNEINLGLIKNYFNVISHCSGKYIMQCAGDDYWLPGKVISQITFMEEHSEIGMCYGKSKLFYTKFDDFRGTFGNETITTSKLLRDNLISAPTVCLQTEYVKKYIGDIDPVSKNWLFEDYPMWLWFSYNTKTYFLDKEMSVYRIIDGSITNPKNDKIYLQLHENTMQMKIYFSNLYNIPISLDNDYRTKNAILLRIILIKKWPSYNDYLFFKENVTFGNSENISSFSWSKWANKSYILFICIFFLKKSFIQKLYSLVKYKKF